MAAVGRTIFTQLATSRIYINQFYRGNHISLISYPQICFRSYHGSKRYKNMYEKKQKEKLEKELEEKYGITKPKFDQRAWFLRNYQKEMIAFQHRMGIVFQDSSVLLSAFVHNSFIEEIEKFNEKKDKSIAPYFEDSIVEQEDENMNVRSKLSSTISDISSEKLSLLGFSTLTFAIKESILRKYQNITVTLCNDLVSFLTSRDIINKIASNIAVNQLMLASKEIENLKDDENDDDSTLVCKQDVICDTFYAVIGAIKKDLGHNAAVNFINDIVTPFLDHEDLSSHVTMNEPHLELKNILSMHGVNGVTRARTIVETGIDTHFPVFYVGIYCNGQKIGEGSSYSAFTARQVAFNNTVFMALENEIDFSKLKKSTRL